MKKGRFTEEQIIGILKLQKAVLSFQTSLASMALASIIELMLHNHRNLGRFNNRNTMLGYFSFIFFSFFYSRLPNEDKKEDKKNEKS